MAQAPALLRGYLDLNRAMKRTHLDRAITERIGLAVRGRPESEDVVRDVFLRAVRTLRDG